MEPHPRSQAKCAWLMYSSCARWNPREDCCRNWRGTGLCSLGLNKQWPELNPRPQMCFVWLPSLPSSISKSCPKTDWAQWKLPLMWQPGKVRSETGASCWPHTEGCPRCQGCTLMEEARRGRKTVQAGKTLSLPIRFLQNSTVCALKGGQTDR